MNWFLVFLVLLSVFLLWVFCVRLFKPIGKLVNKIASEWKKATSEEDKPETDSDNTKQEEKGENKNE